MIIMFVIDIRQKKLVVPKYKILFISQQNLKVVVLRSCFLF